MPPVIYKDHRGNRLPSVTTIIGRFKESGGLLYWANQQGLEGKTLDQARAEVTTPGAITSRGGTGSGSPANAASLLSRLWTASARWQNRSSQKQGRLNPRWPRCQRVDTRSWTKRDRRSNDALMHSSHNRKN